MFDNQLALIYSNEIFQPVLNGQIMSVFQFNAATNFLIYAGIPYDVSFVPGSRKEAAALQLTVHINPTRTEVFVVALSPGSTVFSPSP